MQQSVKKIFCLENIAKKKFAQLINMQVIFLFIQPSFFRGNRFVPDTADNLPPTDCSLPNLRGEKKGGKTAKQG